MVEQRATRMIEMDDGYGGKIEVPAPTIKLPWTPSRIAWNLYGHAIFRPLHRIISRLDHYDLIGEGWDAKWTARHPLWQRFRKYVTEAPKGKALIQCRVRYFLSHLIRPLHQCPHCNDDTWLEDERHDEDGTTTKLFDCTGSGKSGTPDGTSYWWEGWRFCYRCGHVEWEHDST